MIALDKNHNKVIDYSEFLTAAVSKSRLLSHENLLKAFKLFDHDGDGTISIDELKSIFESNGTKKEEKLWIQIMKEVDTNQDGVINFEEFVNSMTKVVDTSFVELNKLQNLMHKSIKQKISEKVMESQSMDDAPSVI